MMDVAGQDATDSFEDVGHSDEAREILEGLKIGTLKRLVCRNPQIQIRARLDRCIRFVCLSWTCAGLVGVVLLI